MAIDAIRKKIDSLDEKLLELLNGRAALVREIAGEKKKSGVPVYIQSREQEILDRLTGKNKGPFPSDSLKSVYAEIFSASRKLETPLRVAFLGPETTFSHIAAIKRFGSSTEYMASDSIRDVFREVENGSANFGVVPVENSTEGTVNHTLDVMLHSDLQIVSEIYLDIHHNLLSKHPLGEIKKVYSIPQALAQCREWLNKNLPGAELIETSSTAKAAETVGVYLNSAAIASRLAAEKFGLKVVAENIEDYSQNVTRFLVIGKSNAQKAKKNKTSIVFSVPHKAGALFSALEPIAKNKVNMTKIESRPTRQKQWDYVFFIDIEGHVSDAKTRKTIGELEKRTMFLKILGSYPSE